MKFFSELKERRLFQILVSYLAAGWIGLEVVDQLTQNEILPGFGYTLALLWFLAGIPAALLIGWHHGEKGRQKAPLSEVVVLVALGLPLLGFSGFTVADHLARQAALEAAEASALALDRIAVLYFDDFSTDGELRPIADGLTESLIDQFAQVRGLEVVSRHGVEQFRGTDMPPDSVAARLQAGTLVAGGVQRVGDKLRVNVALLEGQTGAPFGRRASFERPADDFFAVRGELAEEVSRMLREWLGSEISLRRTRNETSSQAAWILYQRAEAARKDAAEALHHHDDHGALNAFARADSLLEQAGQLDPRWVAPLVLQGEIDYTRSRLAHDRHDRVAAIEGGLEKAGRALELDRNDADALSLRGTLRYYKYLQDLAADDNEAEALFASARADLEKAVDLDPTQASAWSALQHIYYSESTADAVLAGQRAYEADAYLDAADVILWRLYTGHYDLGNFTQARRWCDEGTRRFPRHDRFATCQLELLHTPAVEGNPDRAWSLAARIDSLAQPNRREYAALQSKLFVAAALRRADMPDSARAVLQRVHGQMNPAVDPDRELLTFEAAVWSMLGEDGHAIDLLKQHKSANPGASFDHHWWWRTVRSHPRYAEIASGHH